MSSSRSTPPPKSRKVPAPTSLLGHFQLLFHYDFWATRLMLDALAPLPPGTQRLRGTVLAAHLVWANEVWYGRVRGHNKAGTKVPGDAEPSELMQRYADTNRRWHELLALLATQALATPVHYTATEGTTHATPLRDVLTHVLHHGSHHRAQMASAIRAAGATPPASDYIFFHRALEEGSAGPVQVAE